MKQKGVLEIELTMKNGLEYKKDDVRLHATIVQTVNEHIVWKPCPIQFKNLNSNTEDL